MWTGADQQFNSGCMIGRLIFILGCGLIIDSLPVAQLGRVPEEKSRKGLPENGELFLSIARGIAPFISS